MIDDLILGYLLTKVFARDEARSPSVVLPSTAQPPPGSAQPAPGTSSPGQPFPGGITPPNGAQTKPPAGFIRAVEVWQINPQIAASAAPAIVGLGVGAEPLTVQMLEAQFPNGWVGKKTATPEEAANARTILKQWKEGGVMFLGPSTLTGRRAYRMAKHPAAGHPQPPTIQPAPQPAPTVPASYTPPEGHPFPRETDPTQTQTQTQTQTNPSNGQITAVRKGEGLAQVARRLGQPETMVSAIVLQRANVPGPDGWYSATDLSKGGLAKKGRKGGLQPGDRLFVPAGWAAVTPGAL